MKIKEVVDKLEVKHNPEFEKAIAQVTNKIKKCSFAVTVPIEARGQLLTAIAKTENNK